MKKSTLIVAFYLVPFFSMYAQLADTARIIVQDGYIEKMDDNIGINVLLNNRYETFFVDAEGADFSIYPNISTNLSVGFDYRFLSASIQFTPDFFPGNGDDDLRGKTKALSMGFSTLFRHWAVTARYAQVKGYYLQNTPDLDPTWQPGDPYVQAPDLRYRGGFVTVGYNFNPKVSLRAVTTFTERQLKSGGSFVLGSSIRYYYIDNKPTSTTQRSSNWDVSVGPGYFYNFIVQEKFFAAIGGAGGAGFVHTTLHTPQNGQEYTTYQFNPALRWEGRAAIGYNGRDFFAGLYANLSGLYFNQQGTTAMNRDLQAYYQFIVGIRLASPKWVKKQMKKLDEKIKL